MHGFVLWRDTLQVRLLHERRMTILQEQKLSLLYGVYIAEKKSWYVVARNIFLLLLNFSAWPFLAFA